MAETSMATFLLDEAGMMRFPPNVERISVDWSEDRSLICLTVRRNDTELKFPLDEAARAHLIGLLEAPGGLARPDLAEAAKQLASQQGVELARRLDAVFAQILRLRAEPAGEA